MGCLNICIIFKLNSRANIFRLPNIHKVFSSSQRTFQVSALVLVQYSKCRRGMLAVVGGGMKWRMGAGGGESSVEFKIVYFT